MFDTHKTRMIALRCGEEAYDDTLSRFDRIPERGGRTDRQNCYKTACMKSWHSSVRCRSGLERRRRRRPTRISADVRRRSHSRSRRAATSRVDRLWDYGVIPYEIDSNFSGNVTPFSHAVPLTVRPGGRYVIVLSFRLSFCKQDPD